MKSISLKMWVCRMGGVVFKRSLAHSVVVIIAAVVPLIANILKCEGFNFNYKCVCVTLFSLVMSSL